MNNKETFHFGPFRLSADQRELSAHGAPVVLGSRGFDLLLALVRRQGQLVSKDELMSEVWSGSVVEEANLQVQISALRKALGTAPGIGQYIATVPGRGYRFVAPIEQHDATKSVPLPDKPSIAVLPFANLSGDPEHEYFADGMAEEILTALARASSLFVIARNSSFVYKGRSVDIREVGRELGVGYVLEGSVRRDGSRLRFTAQLISADSGAHIWAERFEGELSDVFDLQDRITEKVVGAIEPTMHLAEIERLKHKTVANLTAYDHLLHAQQLEYEFTAESLDRALGHLRQALAIDPTYAVATAFAAYCYGWRQAQGWATDTKAESAEGLRLLSRALELGKFDSTVLWLSAFATWQLGLDERSALDLAYRSLETNPNSANSLTIAGRVEALSGNYAKGKELLTRALRLNPRDPRAGYAYQGIAVANLGEGEFEEAAFWARKALAQNSRLTGPTRVLAASLAFLGQTEAASATIASLLSLEPGLTVSKFRSRRMFICEGLWEKLSQGLRLAGLPD